MVILNFIFNPGVLKENFQYGENAGINQLNVSISHSGEGERFIFDVSVSVIENSQIQQNRLQIKYHVHDCVNSRFLVEIRSVIGILNHN